jgi:hypothetical protein
MKHFKHISEYRQLKDRNRREQVHCYDACTKETQINVVLSYFRRGL